jgi:hypothetical protein
MPYSINATEWQKPSLKMEAIAMYEKGMKTVSDS